LHIAGRFLPALLLIALAFSVRSAGAAPAAQQEPLEAGRGVRVIDGDTLQIDDHTLQLYGIDAPELGQYCQRGDDLWACGLEAAMFLQKTVEFEGPPIECLPWGEEPAEQDGSGLVIGVCQVGPKVVGLTMVRNGYAVALPESFPDYKEAEEQAQQAKLGLWQSDFVPPWEWREGKGPEVKSSDWVRTCNIKGALGPADEPIYYVPTDAEYERVAIDPARGGQMFCSDEEARAAGWTRPRETPPAE
jgi:endonuclease YncB( thermonuclease family)